MTVRNQRPQGLKQPVGVNPKGGASLVSGDAQLMKLLTNAFRPCYSTNPFQKDLDITGNVAFQLNDDNLVSKLRNKIKMVSDTFKELSRAEIDIDKLIFYKSPGGEELNCKMVIINLETDTELGVNIKVSSSGINIDRG